MTTPTKVLVFAGSNSTQSINKRLAAHAANVFQDEMTTPVEIEILDLNDFEMPIYSMERQAAGFPQEAQDFYAKIGAADALIVSLAEHNGSYSTAFKNIFDWSSRINMEMFQKKPMLLMATSPGPGGGRNVHGAAMGGFPFFGAEIASSFSFGPFGEHFDDETESLKTPELVQELKEAVVALKEAVTTQKAVAA